MSGLSDILKHIARTNVTILDIGANNGDHSLHFLNVFPYGRIFSFEPDPRAIAKYRATVSSERAKLVEAGIGAETGRSIFYQSGGQPWEPRGQDWSSGWDLSGSIRRPKTVLQTHPWLTFDEKIEIDVMRLDDWAARERVHGVDLIWADVQGAEADLISGGRETLKHTKFFYTEYCDKEFYEGAPTLNNIIELLPDFQILGVYPGVHEGDVLFKNKRDVLF